MKHLIDPKVDCVFKALFGSEQNKNLLIHFLNAVIRPRSPIDEVELRNPYNEKTFEGDKLTIVDIKAHEKGGRWFQVEIQLAVHAGLAERQLFTWAEIYRAQLTESRDYEELVPAISIWLVNGRQFKTSPGWRHHFQLIDRQTGLQLSQHCSIYVLEIPKWSAPTSALDNEGQWLYFLKEAETWTQLPTELNTVVMRQAMSTLKGFSEKEEDYLTYLGRLDAHRLQLTMERSLKRRDAALRVAEQEMQKVRGEFEQFRIEKQQALNELEHAREEKEQELSAKEQALAAAEAELERLRALLKER